MRFELEKKQQLEKSIKEHRSGVFCRGCCKIFEKKKNSGFSKYCSSRCRIEYPPRKKCKPCLKEDFENHHVTFLDGTKHIKRICNKCRNGNYVSEKEKKDFKKNINYKGNFYRSQAWLSLRYDVLRKYGPTCMLCKSTSSRVNVDHIEPRKKRPDLELVFENLQVLCGPCNHGKLNRDNSDFRPRS